MEHKGSVKVVQYKTRSQCISQGNQVRFEQILKLLINLFIFPMVKIFS